MAAPKLASVIALTTLAGALAVVGWRAFVSEDEGAPASGSEQERGAPASGAQTPPAESQPHGSPHDTHGAPSDDPDEDRTFRRYNDPALHVRAMHGEALGAVHDVVYDEKRFPDTRECKGEAARSLRCRKLLSEAIYAALQGPVREIAVGRFGMKELIEDYGNSTAGITAEDWATHSQTSDDPIERTVGLEIYRHLAASCGEECRGLPDQGYRGFQVRTDPELVMLASIHQHWPSKSSSVVNSFVEAAADEQRDLKTRTACVKALGQRELSGNLADAMRSLPPISDDQSVRNVAAALSNCGADCGTAITNALVGDNVGLVRAALWSLASLPAATSRQFLPRVVSLANDPNLSFSDLDQIRYLQERLK
jgi:hypothetical protein